MLEINATSKFKKDRKRCIKRGYDMGLLIKIVNTLCIPAPLPPANKDHALVGIMQAGGNAILPRIGYLYTA